MIADYEDDDAHFCLKCHITIIGLDNYVTHRKTGCAKALVEPPKSPLPSQLLISEDSSILKADDFFSSLELQSSAKKNPPGQSTSGKQFSGILTRSKTTAVLQATTSSNKEQVVDQSQSKSGKHVWIGGHQLEKLGHGDNQSKLIKAVDNLERRKEDLPKITDYEDSDEFSELEFEEDYSSEEDNQEYPSRHYTGGKWKPASPVSWSRQQDGSTTPPSHTGGKWRPGSGKGKVKYDDIPPPSFTGSKWVPSKHQSPTSSYTKGKWKPRQDEYDDIPPPSFTGSKWVPSKHQTPSSSYTKGKWKPRQDEDDDISPPTTGSKWVPSKQQTPSSSYTKGKWKPKQDDDDDIPPPSFTGSKWVPSKRQSPSSSYTKGKWKPGQDDEDNTPPPTFTGSKWVQSKHQATASSKTKFKSKDEDDPSPEKIKIQWQPKEKDDGNIPQETALPKEKPKVVRSLCVNEDNLNKPIAGFTKGKWLPIADMEDNKSSTKKLEDSLLRKSSGTVQYYCKPCDRRLASKVVYERHLKSELHFKRTLKDQNKEENFKIIKEKTMTRSDLKLIPFDSKKRRIKIYERCKICNSNVNKLLMGKHLISNYHCRKGDISSATSKCLVLENIHSIVLQSPFQCQTCKFYCNTHDTFLNHWTSEQHHQRHLELKGYFYCSFCKFKAEDNNRMYEHLISQDHMEVVYVINRSTPIIIKKVNPVHCLTCDKEFVLNMELIKHCETYNHNNHNVVNFKCVIICLDCNVCFKKITALERHRKKVHGELSFNCNPCCLKFESEKELIVHRKTAKHRLAKMIATGDEKLKRKCTFCKTIFDNIFKLREHINEKHPELKTRCSKCGEEFSLPQDLATHLRMKQCKFKPPQKVSNENILTCDKCLYSTISTSELLYHKVLHNEPIIKGEHLKNSQSFIYRCPICNRLFPKPSLLGHLRVHNNERPFVCKLCNASFARKNNLFAHMKNIHEKKEGIPEKKVVTFTSGQERTFLCSVCGASFFTKGILQQHMMTHTGKLFKCPEPGCIYTGRKESEIKTHYVTHCDERKFSCDYCEYKSKTKNVLRRHMLTHNDIRKEYVCVHCQHSALTPAHLKRHLRLHTGAKPFNCPHCEYKCYSLDNLRKHILSTNKHPGKCIYQCKFCADRDDVFQANFAKDFKAHLVQRHPNMFGSGKEAASYVAAIYDIKDDSTAVINDVDMGHQEDGQGSNMEPEVMNVVTLICNEDIPSTSSGTQTQNINEILPVFLPINKDEIVLMENHTDSWNLVGQYDVEQSGALVPFQSADEDSLFQEHF